MKRSASYSSTSAKRAGRTGSMLSHWLLGDVGPIVIGLLDIARDVFLKEFQRLLVVVDVELAVAEREFVRVGIGLYPSAGGKGTEAAILRNVLLRVRLEGSLVFL